MGLGGTLSNLGLYRDGSTENMLVGSFENDCLENAHMAASHTEDAFVQPPTCSVLP